MHLVSITDHGALSWTCWSTRLHWCQGCEGIYSQWMGVREELQETLAFSSKFQGFWHVLADFPYQKTGLESHSWTFLIPQWAMDWMIPFWADGTACPSPVQWICWRENRGKSQGVSPAKSRAPGCRVAALTTHLDHATPKGKLFSDAKSQDDPTHIIFTRNAMD